MTQFTGRGPHLPDDDGTQPVDELLLEFLASHSITQATAADTSPKPFQDPRFVPKLQWRDEAFSRSYASTIALAQDGLRVLAYANGGA
jgi:hypothetical protein